MGLIDMTSNIWCGLWTRRGHT